MVPCMGCGTYAYICSHNLPICDACFYIFHEEELENDNVTNKLRIKKTNKLKSIEEFMARLL